MDFSNYLGKTIECGCGKTHRCEVKEIRIGHGVRKAVPGLLKCYSRVLVVEDENTDLVCGAELKRDLREAGISVKEVVWPGQPVLVPDETAIERLEQAVTEDVQVLVGVGSGVINDLCKLVSFRKILPYMIVATAPSMDGFASVGAAMILGGMKVTLNAHVPSWIIGDTEILCNAPMPMLRAGIGDMIGKYSCLNDWKLSTEINGEYFCPMVHDLVRGTVDACMETIGGVLERDEESVGHLTEGLVLVGIGMSYMGNSRPASGAEHHLSHFYEVTGLLRSRPYLPHGIDVGYASYVTAVLRRRLAQENPARFTGAYDKEKRDTDIRNSYGTAAEGIIKLQERVGFYGSSRTADIREKWEAVRRILMEAPSGSEVYGLLRRAGYENKKFLECYGEDTIRESIRMAKDLKDRYTLFWILQDTGLLEEYAADVEL